ncbi:MAG: peptidylprolyl isomerase [Rhodovulum sp.]|jgi:peptidyl-prolyl cis-trans isomerase C|nr:peptidylprolyl isomerase [Rhodovulum sp.]|tara:strand:+ start:1639 stop:2487 length:849 start_codon:yes stop_codon:yes gene_type:complete
MTKNIFTALAMTTAIAFTSVPAVAQETDLGTVVATVNGEEITLGHMLVLSAQLPQEYNQLPDDVLFDAVLDQLVRQAAIAQGLEGGLSTASELALENQRRTFMATETLNARVEAEITEEKIQAAYDADYANAEPEPQFNASHILVPTEEEALEVKALLDGGADFAETAKEKSTGPSGPSGGELGWFGKGMMVEPFEAAVLEMAAGDVSGPVQTQFGWHIIKVNETGTLPIPPLEQVRSEIEERLNQAFVESLIAEYSEAAEIVKPETAIDPTVIRDMELLEN